MSLPKPTPFTMSVSISWPNRLVLSLGRLGLLACLIYTLSVNQARPDGQRQLSIKQFKSREEKT